MELKDAPVRTSLEMIFKQAGIKSYVIENSVYGVISMNLSEQPFENALKLVMRANTIPLTYTRENDVYIVKLRKFTEEVPTKLPDIQKTNLNNNIVFERIPLTFIDPLDLQIAFGRILYIRQFSGRMGMNNSFNNMGNMGSNNMGGGRNF